MQATAGREACKAFLGQLENAGTMGDSEFGVHYKDSAALFGVSD